MRVIHLNSLINQVFSEYLPSFSSTIVGTGKDRKIICGNWEIVRCTTKSTKKQVDIPGMKLQKIGDDKILWIGESGNYNDIIVALARFVYADIIKDDTGKTKKIRKFVRQIEYYFELEESY